MRKNQLKLTFSWKIFIINQIPILVTLLLTIGLFLAFPPPEIWGHESTEFRRQNLVYVGLLLIPFYIIYFFGKLLKPNVIRINFHNHNVNFGKKNINIRKVRRIIIQNKKRQKGILISIENVDVIFKIPPWYQKKSLFTTVLRIKSYCRQNGIELKIMRE